MKVRSVNRFECQGYIGSDIHLEYRERLIGSKGKYYCVTNIIYINPRQVLPSKDCPVVPIKESISLYFRAYNTNAITLKKFCKKGSYVWLIGYIDQHDFLSEDKKKKVATFINVDNLYINGKGGEWIEIQNYEEDEMIKLFEEEVKQNEKNY